MGILTPVVVVLVVLLALVALGALLVFGVGRLVRHWSRTREQANVVFAVQMELMAMVQAAVQQCEGSVEDRPVIGGGPEAQWAAIDARARAAIGKNLGLLQDRQLRRLTTEMLDCTGRLSGARDAGEAAVMRKELEGLQHSFKARSDEVIRDLRLGR